MRKVVITDDDSASALLAKNKDSFWLKVKKQKGLVIMTVPFILYVLLFRYVPIAGWVMAFKNYMPGLGVLESPWVGFDHFRALFEDPAFFQVLRNTLAMNVIRLALGMFFSILLALILNEVRNMKFKKFAQTASYLPYFISWVVAANLILNALSTDGGIINEVLMALNIIEQPIMFMGIPELFWWIVGLTNVWKTAGYGAILYLASIASINPNLYEAAVIDGASRLQKIRHITLPSIKPVIVILLIMNIGQLMMGGFEQVYLLQNGRVIEYSRIFTIFELEYGIRMMRYSYATAVGIFRGIISIILLFSANYAAKKLGQERLF